MVVVVEHVAAHALGGAESALSPMVTATVVGGDECVSGPISSSSNHTATADSAFSPEGFAPAMAHAGSPLLQDALDSVLQIEAPDSGQAECETLILHLAMRAEVNIQADEGALYEVADDAAPAAGIEPVGQPTIAIRKRRSRDDFYVVVDFQDKPMHIHRLISLLNRCSRKPFMVSNDRLKRVTMAAMLSEKFNLSALVARPAEFVALEPGPAADPPENGVPIPIVAGHLGLGADIAFVFQECIPGSKLVSVRFWIGRVYRLLQHKPGTKWRLLTENIPLASIKDGTIKDVYVQCSWFKPVLDDYRACTQYTFITEATELKAVPAMTALCETSLSLSVNAAGHAGPRPQHVHELLLSELAAINQLFSAFTEYFPETIPEPTMSFPAQKPVHADGSGKAASAKKRARTK